MEYEGFRDSAGDGLFANNAVPSCEVGEFGAPGVDPVVADLGALSFSETSRTPVDGFMARDQSKFPTRDAHGKQS